MFVSVQFVFLIVSITYHTVLGIPFSRSLHTSSRAICPSEDFALIPAEKCNQFYLCSQGESTLLDCDVGENFNPNISLCDANYECVNEPEPTTTEPPTTTTTAATTSAPTTTIPTVTPPSEGFLAVLLPMELCPPQGVAYRIHGQNCRLFYYCRDGFERLQSCSAFRRFDVFTGQCLLTHEATCYPGTELFDDRDVEYDAEGNVFV